ncbi:MAG: AraC family transcriptional regulator [Proteobacteria bacterium]|nr:AraC family transcriptional regulator [Pseudomonadota bacterium]
MNAAGELIVQETENLASAVHSMLGLGALFAEMAEQGVAAEALLQGTGLHPGQLDDPRSQITQPQKVAIFRNVQRLTTVPEVGLRAGWRQRLSDFGVYGYALVSSRTFGEAVALGIKHVRLAGPVLEKRFRIEGDTAIFEARDVLDLDDMLPLATEFWFASVLKLATCVLEAPMPSRRLLLPYPRPPHAAACERLFGCPVVYDAGVMEWHFDAAVLRAPCPNANPITAGLCAQFCERMVASLPSEADLSRSIRAACLNSRGVFPTADEMAARLGLSVRTLHRRLADQGLHYQPIVDDVRRTLAIEFLRNTSLPVEEIAGRVGFSEASNFRKAFRKWTGRPPTHFRAAGIG